MKCPKCHEEIENDAKFCTKCGSNIEEATKELEKGKVEETTEEVENETKQDENLKVEENEKNTQVANEEKKTKKKNKKKIAIIITIIILALLLLGGVGIGTWMFLRGESEQKEETKLEWGDIYLEVLNDSDKLEDMDEQKIQLCDLDKDSIPELIIYGIKNATEYIANIYKINDKNEVDTIKVSLDNEFDIKLVYDSNKDDYVWYAVSEEKDNTTKIYNLNIENGKYESEEIELNLGIDSLEIEDNYSEKIDFDKDANKEEKQEILNQAINTYVPTEEMITDEIKEEVENIKLLKNIKKIDSSKDIVYSVEEYKVTNTGETYKYPAINIDSEDIKKVNSEIEEKYGFKSSDYTTNGYIISLENEESGYKYYINGHILSVIVYNGGNDSVWSTAYNVNLQDQSVMTNDELLQEKGLDKNEVIQKAYEAAQKEMEDVLDYDEKALGNIWDTMYPETEVTTWKDEMQEDIENLTNAYLNENGELCILAPLHHAGGQYSCWKNIIINVTNNYSITELLLDIWNGQEQNVSAQTETTQTMNQSNTNTNSNTNSSTASSSNTSNIKAIIDLDKMKEFTYDTSLNTPVAEGTYTGPMGTLKITNSTGNTFDFEFECYKQTSAGYGPNIGMMSGTAKGIKGGNFVFSEEKTEGSYSYKYNIFFYLAGGNSITVEDECYDNISGETQSPYCGNGVMFSGTYTK